MQIRITRRTTIHDAGGGEHRVAPGDIEEVDRATAQLLVGMGKAEFYSGEEIHETEPPETATAEPPETAMKPPARQRR